MSDLHTKVGDENSVVSPVECPVQLTKARAHHLHQKKKRKKAILQVNLFGKYSALHTSVCRSLLAIQLEL